ncbi:MAG: GxxExxY protein [bacterium]
MHNKLLYGDLTERIIGVFYQVHWELGPGFLESIYARATQIALDEAGLRVQREILVAVYFRGRQIGTFRPDMIVESVILLEFKAGAHLDPDAEGQVVNYLKVTRLEVGLCLHFGPKPSFRRFIQTNDRKLLP